MADYDYITVLFCQMIFEPFSSSNHEPGPAVHSGFYYYLVIWAKIEDFGGFVRRVLDNP